MADLFTSTKGIMALYTSYRNWLTVGFTQFPHANGAAVYLSLSHDRFLPNPFPSSPSSQPFNRLCIIMMLKALLNNVKVFL
jgi:hypothetical protein